MTTDLTVTKQSAEVIQLHPPKKPKPVCDFCMRPAANGRVLIGEKAHICSECLGKANNLIKESEKCPV